LPINPKRLAGNDPTGDVPTQPSAPLFWYGNRPCQVFAINCAAGLTSSPQAYVEVLPARAAYSHSAFVREAPTRPCRVRRVERPLRYRHIPGVGNELRELPIGNRVLFDREGLDMPIMDRPLVWVELLRAHLECATGQLDQV
jgi:hypothetical protein